MHLKLFAIIGVGNLAYDRSETHPARVNRWALRGRSRSSLANTIVHEAAHAAGMRHDGKYRYCGPPYVVGEIVERLESGRSTAPALLCPALGGRAP